MAIFDQYINQKPDAITEAYKQSLMKPIQAPKSIMPNMTGGDVVRGMIEAFHAKQTDETGKPLEQNDFMQSLGKVAQSGLEGYTKLQNERAPLNAQNKMIEEEDAKVKSLQDALSKSMASGDDMQSDVLKQQLAEIQGNRGMRAQAKTAEQQAYQDALAKQQQLQGKYAEDQMKAERELQKGLITGEQTQEGTMAQKQFEAQQKSIEDEKQRQFDKVQKSLDRNVQYAQLNQQDKQNTQALVKSVIDKTGMKAEDALNVIMNPKALKYLETTNPTLFRKIVGILPGFKEAKTQTVINMDKGQQGTQVALPDRKK